MMLVVAAVAAIVLSILHPIRVDRLLVDSARSAPRGRGHAREYSRIHPGAAPCFLDFSSHVRRWLLAVSRYQREDGREETMDFKLERDMHSFYKARKLGLNVSPATVNTPIPVFYAEGLEVRRDGTGAWRCSVEWKRGPWNESV